MTDPRTPRTEAGRALLEAGFGVYHHDACGYHDHTQRECDCSLPRRVRGIEAEASEDVRAAAWEAVRWLEYGTDRAEGDAATASRLRAILAADPTLSDPDAERQRAIGEDRAVRLLHAIREALDVFDAGRGGFDAVLRAALRHDERTRGERIDPMVEQFRA
jgi:hypothetical protein